MDELVPIIFTIILLLSNWLIKNILVKNKCGFYFSIALGYIVGFIYTYILLVIVVYLEEGNFYFIFPNYFMYKEPPVTVSLILGTASAYYFGRSIKRVIANNEKLSGT